MANPVLTLEAANIYCGSAPNDNTFSNHLQITEVKLPGFDEAFVDHRPGGAPVAIEIDTQINRFESTFTLMGWSPQVATLVHSWLANQNNFFVYGGLRDRETGDVLHMRAQLRGRLGRADPQNWRRGDVGHWNYAIRGMTYYFLGIDNATSGGGTINMYEWDFFTNLLRIGGVDKNGDINAALGISTPSISVNVGQSGLTSGA